MSAPAIQAPAVRSGPALWRLQGSAIFWTELKKNFITKRGFWAYLLAFAPVAIVTLHSIVSSRIAGQRGYHLLSKDTEIMAGLFMIFFLRPAVFFGCVGIFTYLFRGEVLERSLHYYLLAPVRRPVLLLAKYGAGLVTACFFFCGSIALTFVAMYSHYPGHEVERFLNSGGYGHLGSYVSITALACMTYGAIFLFAGIRWTNPIVPAVFLLIWESINLFLPSWMKKASVLYYLRSMAPVSVPITGPAAMFGGMTDPVSTAVAVPSLLLITAIFLFLAIREFSRTEVSYSAD